MTTTNIYETREQIPAKQMGVYIFISDNNQIYIGESTNIRARLKNKKHKTTFHTPAKIITITGQLMKLKTIRISIECLLHRYIKSPGATSDLLDETIKLAEAHLDTNFDKIISTSNIQNKSFS